MAAVIRLKRKREDDPVEVLMITSKRSKSDDQKCKLIFAGTSKNEEGCLRVVKRALHMELLESHYSSTGNSEPMCTLPLQKIKAYPADDLKVVSRMGSQSLETLFSPTLLQGISKIPCPQSKFQLLDLEKESKDSSTSEYVYDVFYTKNKSILDANMHDMNFIYYYSSELEQNSEDESDKEEMNLQMNYFEEDADAEGHWRADYPDENNVFFRKKEDNPSSESECDGDGDECEEAENDYGEYLDDFVNKVVNSKVVRKG